MSILVDTNILLRRIQPDHAHHAVAIESVPRHGGIGGTLPISCRLDRIPVFGILDR
jgi:hypothetical protein